MGCNTSQELKTKDNAAANDNGDEAASNADSSIPNGEQNGNLSSSCEKQKNSAGGGDAACRKSPSSSAKEHNKKTTTNVILSNGDMIKYTKGDSCSSSNGFDSKKDTSDDMNFEMGDDEAKAATKIQAVFRGHQVRSTMKKSETSSANTTAAANNGTAVAAAAAAEPEPTKEELEAEFDPNNKELCDAALKIQSTFRGHMSRKIANKEQPEDVDIQEITKKVAEELDIDLTDPELNKAATKIQASFRGHKIRKDCE